MAILCTGTDAGGLLIYLDMKSTRAWQVAFVVGLISLLVAGSAVFGGSAFLTVVGVATVIVSVLNFLLSTDAQHSQSWAKNAIARILNVTPLLRVAVAAVLCGLLFVISIGGVKVHRWYIEQHQLSLSGLILTAGGDPITRATVTLVLRNQQIDATATDGKFTFNSIDVREETSGHVKVMAKAGSREGIADIDLTKGLSQNIVIRLSPGDPPFRVTYFLLERQAIDFLLQGKVNPQWEQQLAGQPFIVPNAVYRSLSHLVASFSKTLDAQEHTFSFYREDRGVRSDPQEGPLSESIIKSYFVADSDGDVIHLDSAVPTLLNTLNTGADKWRVFIDPSRSEPLPYPLVFRRFVDRSDFSVFSQEPVSKFYSFITQQYMPADFGYFEMRLFGICSDDPPWYMAARYVGRLLRLRVAVIENITSDPIKIGNFSIRENDATGIHSDDDNKAQLQKAEPKQEALFPMEMLRPGERVIVPVEMQLAANLDDATQLIPLSDRQDVRSAIRARGMMFFGAQDSTSGASVPSTTLEAMGEKSRQIVSLERQYLLGPSISIDSLEVDRVAFPFRQFDPARIVIFDDIATGSCPYVYTYSDAGAFWHNEGVILRGKIGPQSKTIEEKPLTFFDGRVTLREAEAEESFIDRVYVRAISADGTETLLSCRNPKLTADDGRIIRLRQGDQVVLTFEMPENFRATRFILGASGYYIPTHALSLRGTSANRLAPRK